jgi:hypothetical protein
MKMTGRVDPDASRRRRARRKDGVEPIALRSGEAVEDRRSGRGARRVGCLPDTFEMAGLKPPELPESLTPNTVVPEK